MAGGQGGGQGLVAEQQAVDGRVVEGDAAKAHVDAALLQGGDLLQAGQLQHGDLGAGPGGAEVAQLAEFDAGWIGFQGNLEVRHRVE